MTRLKWCKERENGSTVTFSDESNFTLLNRKTTPFVRRFKHEKYQSRFCKKKIQAGGGSIGIWSAFSYDGIGPCKTYPNRMNQWNYQDILKECLILWREKCLETADSFLF